MRSTPDSMRSLTSSTSSATRRNLTVMSTNGDEKNVEEREHERKGSYAESVEKQAEFEELVREEGNWQKAVDDIEEGKHPEKDPKERKPPSTGM